MTSSVRAQPPTTARSQNKLDLKSMNGSPSVLPSSSETKPEQSTYRSADSLAPDLRTSPATPPSSRFTSSAVSSTISTPSAAANPSRYATNLSFSKWYAKEVWKCGLPSGRRAKTLSCVMNADTGSSYSIRSSQKNPTGRGSPSTLVSRPSLNV